MARATSNGGDNFSDGVAVSKGGSRLKSNTAINPLGELGELGVLGGSNLFAHSANTFRTLANTSPNIAAVSRPVFVFKREQ